MDPFCDNFISYENQPSPNFEGLLDSGFSLTSPFSESVDSFCNFPDFFPKTIQNLLEPDLIDHKGSSDLFSNISVPKYKPFQIIKSQKTRPIAPVERLDYTDQPVPEYSPEIETESENKINNRSKRIAKMAKAKGKVQSPQDHEDLIKNMDVRLIPEGFGDPALDVKTQRKMVKMIKNRISAQNSRDKKKFYTQQLEEMNNAYADENMFLKQERNILLEKIEKLEADYALLRKENEAMKNNAINMCYKCGSTSEFETTATEPSDHVGSPIPQIISNNHGNGGFSIFSVALAALLCFLFVITGGQLGELPTAVLNNIKTPTIIRLSRSLLSEFTMTPLKKLEESAEDLETSLKDLNFGDLPVFNKIKPLMEQFEKLHHTVAAAESSNDNTVNFENSGVESQSKISTLFVPAGFELSKSAPKMEVEGDARTNLQLVTEGYNRQEGFEKADFIQLLVPRNTIGKLSVAEDSNEIKSVHDDCSRHEGENSLMEVWCKVIARRSSLITLA